MYTTIRACLCVKRLRQVIGNDTEKGVHVYIYIAVALLVVFYSTPFQSAPSFVVCRSAIISSSSTKRLRFLFSGFKTCRHVHVGVYVEGGNSSSLKSCTDNANHFIKQLDMQTSEYICHSPFASV